MVGDGGGDDRFLDRAINLARRAGRRGDDPFGSVLVRDDEIQMEASNRTHTDADIAAHPELSLARRAENELSTEQRQASVLYTSTEPCTMCATGIVYAGLGAVVYAISGSRVADLYDSPTGIPCPEVFDRFDASISVDGPRHESAGMAVHREFHDG